MRRGRQRRSKKYLRTPIPRFKPRAHPSLEGVFAAIGVPEEVPFKPDPFQLEALAAIERADCLVTAPTGAGKTWIAEQAIARLQESEGRTWYASPLKALTNSKHGEFSEIFGADQVGILTGDRKENVQAPIIVGTTEILRNQLYDAMHSGEDLPVDLVVLDEAHFLGDEDRGVVWEEVMIYLPVRIPLLMLSATIGNGKQIAAWLSTIRHKPCVVVEETHRPVDLYPLFLHPSGTLLPLLRHQKQKIHGRVREYLEDKNPPLLAPPRSLPPFAKIIRALRKYDLLPAIFFMKSRADCDRALDLCRTEYPYPNEARRERIGELLTPHVGRHKQLWHLEHLGVGAHHGGQLPAWKLVLETLMTEGLLDAVFATSTVSAGVNFPARSVVFFNSDRFNGVDFAPLTPTELHQMIGRAGRRGMDQIGFAVVVPGRFMDVRAVARLLASPPSDISSQIKVSFSMALNLLLSHTPEDVETLFDKSFATYSGDPGRGQRTYRDFTRHLRYLGESGYVTQEGTLTEDGRWASQLRVDQPLVIGEGLRRGLLPASDPALLAAIIASFVDEREQDEGSDRPRLPRPLEAGFVRVQRGLRSTAARMAGRGFEVRAPSYRPAVTMYAWATGRAWGDVVFQSGMAEGHLVMLISRTADNLRHISSLGRAYPQVARTAGQAVQLIMREPVVV